MSAKKQLKKPAQKKRYDAEDIRVLEGLEPVRVRPGMYIGGTDAHGYHHLLREILDNSVDEAINGHASRILVRFDEDYKGATIQDDGRGIPVAIMPKYKKPAVEMILCTLHAGGKFDAESYDVSGGLHGVGSSVVNALSEKMEVHIERDGFLWRQSYSRGKALAPLKKGEKSKKTGTRVHFRPDPQIFGPHQKFDPKKVKELLEGKSFLHPKLFIEFEDPTAKEKTTYHEPKGLRAYLPRIVENKGTKLIHEDVFLIEREDYPPTQIILGWTDASDETLISYANGVRTPDGGAHEAGFKQAVVKAVRAYMTSKKRVPKGVTITSEDIREGLVGVLSLYLREPQFQGQTKGRLNNPEASAMVENYLRPELERWLLSRGSIADAICDRAELSARAREASKMAIKEVKRKSEVSRRLNLPGKLADCASTNPKNSELFIVEGESAGGSAKKGRDRKTQAILPLRGKVLNTMQASLSKVLENKELGHIVSALGCGVGPKMDLSNLRYDRVFLLMDADSDGHHISTLLLTFFAKYMRPLLEKGHIYLAQPPLYRIDVAKDTKWALDDKERDKILKELPKNARAEVSRFKGLGEMPAEDLKSTTLDPEKRRAFRVQLDKLTDKTLEALMGKDAAPRFKFIMENSRSAEALDV